MIRKDYCVCNRIQELLQDELDWRRRDSHVMMEYPPITQRSVTFLVFPPKPDVSRSTNYDIFRVDVFSWICDKLANSLDATRGVV